MASKNRYTDLAIILLSTLCFIFLLNVADYFLLLRNVPDLLMGVFLFPFAEELYKYFFARKMQRKAFVAILIFAAFEVFVVKIPLLYLYGDSLSWLFLLSMTPAFIFHVLTALNYTSNQFLEKPKMVFCAMIILHFLFNYLSYLINDDTIFFLCAMLFALTPLVWMLLSNRVLSRNAALG